MTPTVIFRNFEERDIDFSFINTVGKMSNKYMNRKQGNYCC